MRRHLSAALLLALAFACKEPPPAQPAQDAFDAGADEEVKPVYAAAEASPVAQRLCNALYAIPADRRAACCSGKPSPGLGLTQCVATLSSALRSGAVSLQESAVAACEAAQTKVYAGCDWVGSNPPAIPAECQDLIRGGRKSGELCRSSLECQDGQRCLGSGPTQAGRCGPPKTDGQICRQSVDALAGFVRQDDERHHPECAGFCGHYRCAPRTTPGGDCYMAAQCPGGQYCDGSKCISGAGAKEGQACLGETCAEGLRCVAFKCAVPLATGASCKSDAQCLGGCLPAHLCGPACNN
jgi:hypothetical protein